MGAEGPRCLLSLLIAMRQILLFLLLAGGPFLWGQEGIPIGKGLDTKPLTSKQLKEVFMGNRSIWNNGNPETEVLTSSHSEGFAKTAEWALNADAFDYQKHWLSLVFQGRTNAPVFLSTEQAVIDYVQNHDGAIGLLFEAKPPEELVVSLQ